jgi:hypothetical protein
LALSDLCLLLNQPPRKLGGSFLLNCTPHLPHMQGEAAAEDPLWPELTSSDHEVLAQAVDFISSARNVTWFPTYGCALLALTPRDEEHIQAAADDIFVCLVGLDEWSFRVHRYMP